MNEVKILITDIIENFKEEVVSVEEKLEKSIIHGDLNEQNLLIRKKKNDPEEEYELFSAIDFGDSHFSPLVIWNFNQIDKKTSKCFYTVDLWTGIDNNVHDDQVYRNTS